MMQTDYEQMRAQMEAILDENLHLVTNLSNAAALIFYSMEKVNWAGFYLSEESGLYLGPFQGKPACVRIPMGKGVCGKAAQEEKTQRVEDVHLFPGHIACDCASESEIVIPIFANGKLWGVLDIDSPEKGRFSPEDQKGLEQLVRLLEKKLFQTAESQLIPV